MKEFFQLTWLAEVYVQCRKCTEVLLCPQTKEIALSGNAVVSALQFGRTLVKEAVTVHSLRGIYVEITMWSRCAGTALQ